MSVRAVPEGYAEIDLGASNWDRGIDDGFEQRLRAEPVWGRHAALDFNGRVWFEDGVFHEQVWIYGTPVAYYSAPTLVELMVTVNFTHGWR